MTEFNLSNKIEPRMFDNGNDVDVLFPKDVKEFIKRLKEGMMCTNRDIEIIDKLAGEKLK